MRDPFGAIRRALACGICAAAGVTTLAGQLSPSGSAAITAHQAGVVAMGSLHALGIAAGLGLLLLAYGLWRGKRLAAYGCAIALALIVSCRLLLGFSSIGTAIDIS